MGKITIECYGKVMYDKTVPDKVAYAILKERQNKDRQFERNNIMQKKLAEEDTKAFM